ncbi:MAG: hypothetical protein ACE5FH_07855 [Candidatus Zixiibacteriota bacterium]
MIRKGLTMTAAIAVLLLLNLQVMAGDSASAAQKEMMQGEHVTFEGSLICLGCSLKKTEGARASCKEFGHRHAIKTADGKYISLLENKYAADLIKGEKYHNKSITAHGVYFASANMLDVESYSVEGKNWMWCKKHKGMDVCPASK